MLWDFFAMLWDLFAMLWEMEIKCFMIWYARYAMLSYAMLWDLKEKHLRIQKGSKHFRYNIKKSNKVYQKSAAEKFILRNKMKKNPGK